MPESGALSGRRGIGELPDLGELIDRHDKATGERLRGVIGKTVGLTTGQAARFCLVSQDSIAKWIKERALPAQRTLGGKFRIFVQDLRLFMVQNDMSTTLLDAELECRPYCWECDSRAHGVESTSSVACRLCPVHRTKAMNCFELRMISTERIWAHANCHECPYYLKWGRIGGATNETTG